MSKVVIHRTTPQAELKAVAEVREMGGKAIPPPMEKRWRRNGGKGYLVPLARGYITTREHMATGTYVKNMIGKCQTGEMQQLYHTAKLALRAVRQQRTRAKEPPKFKAGETVQINDNGPFHGKSGKVIETRGRIVRVSVQLFNTVTPLSISVFGVTRLVTKGIK